MKTNLIKIFVIIYIITILFSITACENNDSINNAVSETQNDFELEINQISTSDFLIYEGVQVVHEINMHANNTYLRSIGCQDSSIALASNLLVEGNIKQAYLCMDGAALLQSLPSYKELSAENHDLDHWDYYLVARIFGLLADEIWDSEMITAFQMVSVSDVISLDEQINKPAVLLLEYDDIDSNCVLASFIPVTNGLTIVNATSIPSDPDLFELLNIDDNSIFTTLSPRDIAGAFSSVSDTALNCDMPGSAKTREWFYNTAISSMGDISKMTEADIGLFTRDPEIVNSAGRILKYMKYGATSYDVFYLTDAEVYSYAIDSGFEPEDISDATLDTISKSLAESYIHRSGGILSVASSGVFAELCASSMYAAEFTGANEGTYYVVIKWPGSYTTVTVMRDTGRGAVFPETHFFNNEDSTQDFIGMLSKYGTNMI